MPTTETVLSNAAKLINSQRETTGNQTTLYRTAAILAAAQLDRPISPQEVARIAACIAQAALALRPDIEDYYSNLIATTAIAASLPADTIPRPNPSERLEETLDDAGRRLAKAFAPSLPKTEATE